MPAELAATIRAVAGSRSLRDLAAEVDVSHETIRSLLRERDPVRVAAGGPV
jgi:hypothetical protein